MKKNEVPPRKVILAAEKLFVALAHESLVRPIVTSYKKQILRDGKFAVAQELRGVDPNAPEMIEDPAVAWLMSKEDFARYHAKCCEAAARAGLTTSHPAGCPLMDAEELVRDATQLLLRQSEDILKMPAEEFVERASDELIREAVDLLLRWASPYVRSATAVLQSVIAPEGQAS